jgi:hypothetical protein
MQKAKTATSYMALLGFLTALCGLLQTMWSTAPWWVKSSAPTTMMIAAADDDDEPVVESISVEESAGLPVGIWILAAGIVIGGAGLTVRLILPRVEKEVARKQEEVRKDLLL